MVIRWWRRGRDPADEKPGPPGPGPDEVSFLAKFSYSWLDPLIARGARRQLEPEDLWDMPEADKAVHREKEFMDGMERERARLEAKAAKKGEEGAKISPSINRVLIRQHRGAYFMSMLLMMVSQLYNLAAPTIIQQITLYLGDPGTPTWVGYVLVLVLAFGQWIGLGVCQSHSFLIMYEIGINARSALISAVYRKSTNLSNSARQKLTVGEIVNLMSNDTQRYVEVTQFLQQIWSGPLVIIVGLALLIRLIGVAALAGFGLMLATIPLQIMMFIWSSKLRRVVMQQSDTRVKLMNEVLQGIKVIKLYAWEDSFLDKTHVVRYAELAAIFKTALLRGINFGLFSAMPSIIAIVALVVYSALGNPLSADIVFPAIAYLNVLRFPLLLLPMLITQLAQLKVSKKRLQALLDAPEMDSNGREWEASEGAGERGGAIEVTGGDFVWSVEDDADLDVLKQGAGKGKKGKGDADAKDKADGDAEDAVDAEDAEDAEDADAPEQHAPFELKDIEFRAEPGELIAVVGAVGSGKSSLVASILGETTAKAGSVKVRGSVAYVAQNAWIFNDTLENNITFNRACDEKLYGKTLWSSALESDVEMLPGGDQTEIGEKGINLSGGQKQRVSIARAVYTDSDVYIFDDPLSAVDAHVGEHIFKECISKQLRKKTRILVTNQLQFLPYADRVYVMNAGRIEEVGTYKELNREGTTLFRIMQTFGNNVQETVTQYDTEHSQQDRRQQAALEAQQHAQQRPGDALRVDPADEGGDLDPALVAQTKTFSKYAKDLAGTKLVDAEGRQEGAITLKVWMDYFRAGGGILLGVVVVFVYVLAQVSNMSPDLWLTYWSSQFEADPEGTQAQLGLYAGVYGALGVVLGLLAISRSVLFAAFSTNAARRLHDNMLGNIMRAPMIFFDTTPLGRILNRFSKDTDAVDSLLPPLMDNQFFLILNMISVYILIAVFLPWFLIAVVPILLMYYGVQYYYRRTSRELQRIESVQRSPIYAHFSESLAGVSTIRAYNRLGEAVDDNRAKQDRANSSYYILQVAMRWLQWRLELVSLCILIAVGCLVVASRDNSGIGLNPAEAGLLLTYTISVTGVTSFMVRGAVELETKLTSVERIIEYAEDVEPEAAAVVENNRPPEDWPSKGRIEFQDLDLRYRPELELVLRQVSLTVEPLWKVGIAGRTGSGKSSLAVALFRLVEPSGGRIVIDGVDTNKIGLKDLRSKIGMIPQDPVIFSGTVRFNIDPFDTKSDAQIWDILEKVQLRDTVANLDGGLEAVVAEGGENFSVGQRQLFCIARAIMRSPKILVLDEATANVDIETDALIQQTIRTQFADCTTLTIAHRINTIIDSDQVLVMDTGQVAEFENPRTLVGTTDSIFASLVGVQNNKNESSE